MAFLFGDGLTVLEQKIEALAALRTQVESRPMPSDPDALAARMSMSHLLTVCHADALRRRAKEAGTLDHLWQLKRAIRDAAAVLEFAYVQNPDELRGFVYGDEPKNFEQWSAGLLNELILSLTASIDEVESIFPHLRDEFDSHRAMVFPTDI